MEEQCIEVAISLSILESAACGLTMFAVRSSGTLVTMASVAHRYTIFSAPVFAAQTAAPVLTPISIDYPEDGSIFPPGITPPTFLWRDAAGTSWSIDISFADNSAPIHATSKGERMQLGPIDPDCVTDSNSPPKLTSAAGRDVDVEAGCRDMGCDPGSLGRASLRPSPSPAIAMARLPTRSRTSRSPLRRTKWARRSSIAMFR